MRSSKLRLLLILLAASSAGAQTNTVRAVAADIDFKFHVGNRTFRPGHYEFIPRGPGLLAVRDSRQRVLDTLLTRTIPNAGGCDASCLVFQEQKGRARLVSIRFAGNDQGLEILGEEVPIQAVRRPEPPYLSPEVLDLFLERSSQTYMKQQNK